MANTKFIEKAAFVFTGISVLFLIANATKEKQFLNDNDAQKLKLFTGACLAVALFTHMKND